jgi:hypothetical protein
MKKNAVPIMRWFYECRAKNIKCSKSCLNHNSKDRLESVIKMWHLDMSFVPVIYGFPR